MTNIFILRICDVGICGKQNPQNIQRNVFSCLKIKVRILLTINARINASSLAELKNRRQNILHPR